MSPPYLSVIASKPGEPESGPRPETRPPFPLCALTVVSSHTDTHTWSLVCWTVRARARPPGATRARARARARRLDLERAPTREETGRRLARRGHTTKPRDESKFRYRNNFSFFYTVTRTHAIAKY